MSTATLTSQTTGAALLPGSTRPAPAAAPAPTADPATQTARKLLLDRIEVLAVHATADQVAALAAAWKNLA